MRRFTEKAAGLPGKSAACFSEKRCIFSPEALHVFLLSCGGSALPQRGGSEPEQACPGREQVLRVVGHYDDGAPLRLGQEEAA